MNFILEIPALVNPEIGLIFWMTLTFVTVLFLLKKYAWKPILKSLQDREDSITSSLSQAEKARSEMANLKSENEALLAEARAEKDKILKEAREMKDKIVSDAKSIADSESKKLLDRAKSEIEKEKSAALEELRKEVAGMSVSIAEKLVQQKLENTDAQRALIENNIAGLASNN